MIDMSKWQSDFPAGITPHQRAVLAVVLQGMGREVTRHADFHQIVPLRDGRLIVRWDTMDGEEEAFIPASVVADPDPMSRSWDVHAETRKNKLVRRLEEASGATLRASTALERELNGAARDQAIKEFLEA